MRHLLALGVLWPALAAVAQPLPVNVDLAPAEITVGDRVEARLTLVWEGEEPSAAPRFPAWEGSWGPAEVLAVSEVTEYPGRTGRRIYTQTIILTAFRTGEIRLPEVTVTVPLRGATVEVPTHDGLFVVRSLLPEESGELAPRAAARPRELAAGRRFWGIAAALSTLCLAAAVVLARRLRRAAVAEATAILPPAPLDELLRRLRELDPSAGSEPAHTALSLALRNFLGRCLGINALESTTSEIQRRLEGRAVASAAAQQTVGLLRDCDQVKFARLEVAGAETGRRLREARQLAREIDAGLRPAEPAAEGAG
ncbi:MAG: hypothetical protein GY856_01800 [bacterium]|nr:hypothetical protein [bacterium]